MAGPREPGEERETLELSTAADILVNECRMVLPGIQAIFGFQLVAVFNQRFSDDLSGVEQGMHLAATCLLAIAAAIVMTPAAIHRHYGGREVTDTFLQVSSLLLLIAMVPLALGLALDLYIIGRLIVDVPAIVAALAAAMFALLLFLWMGFPRMRAAQIALARHSQ